MRSPKPSAAIIECPHCGTRYQVAADALGAKGRQVQCAHCSQAWLAQAVAVVAEPAPVAAPDSDRLFDEEAERELDAAFAAEALAAEAEAAAEQAAAEWAAPDEDESPADGPPDEPPDALEEAKAAIAPKPKPEKPQADPALKKLQKAFRLRQDAMHRQLPLARVRRGARIAGIGVLAVLVAGGIALRTEIVRKLPDLAGVYEMLGMGVNIVGLEFRDVTTLVALRNGVPVMQVDARIYSVSPQAVMVQPVVISLYDDAGTSLYQWSVTPDVRDLVPGEVVDFSAQLNSPPAGATRVKLTFSDDAGQSAIPAAAAAQSDEPKP